MRKFKLIQTDCIDTLTEKYLDFYFELFLKIEFDIEE